MAFFCFPCRCKKNPKSMSTVYPVDSDESEMAPEAQDVTKQEPDELLSPPPTEPADNGNLCTDATPKQLKGKQVVDGGQPDLSKVSQEVQKPDISADIPSPENLEKEKAKWSQEIQEPGISARNISPKNMEKQKTTYSHPGPSRINLNAKELHQTMEEQTYTSIQVQKEEANLDGKPTMPCIGILTECPKSSTDVQTGTCNNQTDVHESKKSDVRDGKPTLNRLKGIRITGAIPVDFLIVKEADPGKKEPKVQQKQPQAPGHARQQQNFDRYNHDMVNDIHEEMGKLNFIM